MGLIRSVTTWSEQSSTPSGKESTRPDYRYLRAHPPQEEGSASFSEIYDERFPLTAYVQHAEAQAYQRIPANKSVHGTCIPESIQRAAFRLRTLAHPTLPKGDQCARITHASLVTELNL
eukprot:1185781-Prorocentrum_minimum.AAC.8